VAQLRISRFALHGPLVSRPELLVVALLSPIPACNGRGSAADRAGESVGFAGSSGQTGSDATGGVATASGGATGTGGLPAIVSSSAAGAANGGSECGNGALDGTEQCDDANTESGDGCSLICQIENNYDCPEPGQPCKNLAQCGNGILTSDETCDDRNTLGGDGCSQDCQTVETGWQCRVPGRPCTPTCGDGVVSGTETCDDGNTGGGDGCSATCHLEIGYRCDDAIPNQCSKTTCGDSAREGAEGCDDGNTMPFDGCSQECQLEPECVGNAPCTSTCGDGIVLGEQCDDGNAASGDGCSKDCEEEPGWVCTQPELGDPMLVPLIYRDFRTHVPSDFEPDTTSCPDGVCAGIAADDLDADGKPVYTGVTGVGVCIESQTTFAEWYRTTPDVNHATAGKLALWRTSQGSYVNRYGAGGEQWRPGVDGNPLFFPVDEDTFTPEEERSLAQVPEFYDLSLPVDVDDSGQQRMHNFSFTSEVRYWFKYESDNRYQLDFVGDDDVWVFINKRLAVDLGGLHSPEAGSVTLDEATAAELGNMQSGNVYEVAVFQAERHTTASSYKLTLRGFNTAPTTCVPECGDGIAVADEECDDGPNNSDTAYGGCTTECRWGPFCGDGLVNGDEECDRGKNNGTQYGPEGCTFGCTLPHFCGDGRLDTDRGEQCDLGDRNGVPLDSSLQPSSDPSAQPYCKIDCKFPAILL
jgi:fibro-slime domain-containing protein